MSQYLLASHVYFCVTGDHVVLLDLKRDKYVGVGHAQMRMLAGCVKGWPSTEQEGSEAAPGPPPGNSFVCNLLGSGMLTTDARHGKEAHAVAMPRPQTTLTTLDFVARSDPFNYRPSVTPGHVVNFLLASLLARAALRWRPIAAVVARVIARKARRAASQHLDLESARKHVAAFVHLRPLLFNTTNACLADSLALLNFLSRYGLFPTWVFGVQTGPFAAHCWVQEGDVVFNDTPDHVRRYTPILTI